jgi:hypothetical protein
MDSTRLTLKAHPAFRRRTPESTLPAPSEDHFPALTLALLSLWESLRFWIYSDPITGKPRLRLPDDGSFDREVLADLQPYCVSFSPAPFKITVSDLFHRRLMLRN